MWPTFTLALSLSTELSLLIAPSGLHVETVQLMCFSRSCPGNVFLKIPEKAPSPWNSVDLTPMGENEDKPLQCCQRSQPVNLQITSSTDLESIFLEEILNVRVQPRLVIKKGASTSNPRTHELQVAYITHLSRMRMRLTVKVFCGTQAECETLANDINAHKWRGGSESWGGQRLLVFINPFCGRGRGLSIYRSSVEPIFQACDVSVHSIVTSRAGEIPQLLQNYELRDFDGVVIVGGDGSFNECLNALLERFMTEAGKDFNDSEEDLVPPTIPVGLIPAGSGNELASHLYGTIDVSTAAINILRGKTIQSNVVSLHAADRLLSYAYLVLRFGFIGDLMRHCEMCRWMGPARYKVIPQRTLLQRRLATVEIEMYLAEEPQLDNNNKIAIDVKSAFTDGVGKEALIEDNIFTSRGNDVQPSVSKVSPAVICQQTPCGKVSHCVDKGHDLLRDKLSRFKWEDKMCTEKLSGEIYDIGLQITQAMQKDGSMATCFGTNSQMTQVVTKCSLCDFILHFTKVRDRAPGMNDFKFVTYRELKAMSVKLADDATRGQHWYFNCDGQVVELTADKFYLRLHPGVLKIFGNQTK